MQPILEFDTAYHCPTGELETVAPGLRRITANNPGPYTFRGTGTYVVGRDKVAVIDPGPEDIKHIDALLSALGDEQVTHIFVTHTHRDHSPGTRLLQQRTGALSYALGTHTAFQRSSALLLTYTRTCFEPREFCARRIPTRFYWRFSYGLVNPGAAAPRWASWRLSSQLKAHVATQ